MGEGRHPATLGTLWASSAMRSAPAGPPARGPPAPYSTLMPGALPRRHG